MANKFLKSFFAEITTIPPALQSPHFYSLDGLRGVAIILVVLSHLSLTSSTTYYIYYTIFNGMLGVVVFFVLSGFLITSLCFKEKVTTGSISLRNFYIRRMLRIFPVAYLYLLVVLILKFIFKLDVDYLSIAGAALYLMDISSIFRRHFSSLQTGHYWSLSVEEQFYIAVPFILKKNFKLYLLLILFIIFILPLIIVLQNHFPVINTGGLYIATHMLIKFQQIAVGCLFAVLIFKYPSVIYMPKPVKIITNLLAIFVIFYVQYNNLFSLQSVFTGLLVSFLSGYIIVTNLTASADPIFWFLNTKLMKRIGLLSYSIYIWQELFTSNDKKLPHFIITFPYNIICIALVSCASYYLYERHFLKLKARFSRVKN